jgi:CRP-like cAMP-binding protein
MESSYAALLANCPLDMQTDLIGSAESCVFAAGETLFVEGDPSDTLILLEQGTCMLSQNAEPLGEAPPEALLDPVAALGGLPHTIRATAITNCKCLRWSVMELLQRPDFVATTRRYLAATLLQVQSRRQELTAPVHYRNEQAQLPAGPFVFKNMTMLIALCDANLDSVRERLPDGLSLFRPTWRKRDSLFIAMADFPLAYPDHTPSARFKYTETTIFAPVRYKGKLGLFVPYIYPSTYEPILLGREIYGFPKQLGMTTFDTSPASTQTASLTVDGEPHLDFTYDQTEPASEPRLVRALSDWMGIQGRVTESAFRLGDALLGSIGIPLYRRVSVYNHKRVPAANTSQSAPVDAVNQLTRAVFSVTHWHDIRRITQATLTMRGGPLRTAGVTLKESYLTRLDMRLSTGQALRDYDK